MKKIVMWLKSLFLKKDMEDEGLNFSSSPSIRVEGKVYPCKIDSIGVLQEAVEMQKELTKLQEKSEDPTMIPKVMNIVKKFIILLLGPVGYAGIFNTEEKKDSYTWHMEVFGELFATTIRQKMKVFDDAVNSPLIKEMKKMQKQVKRG